MYNGITHAVNYKTQDFAAETKKTTDGNGIDVLIDFVGRTHWAKNIESLTMDEKMTILSLLSGVSLRCMGSISVDNVSSNITPQ